MRSVVGHSERRKIDQNTGRLIHDHLGEFCKAFILPFFGFKINFTTRTTLLVEKLLLV